MRTGYEYAMISRALCIQTNVRSWRTSAQRTRDASTLMAVMSARPDVGIKGLNRKQRSQNVGLGACGKKSAKSAGVTRRRLLSLLSLSLLLERDLASVCLSHSRIGSKLTTAGSCGFHHRIAQDSTPCSKKNQAP